PSSPDLLHLRPLPFAEAKHPHSPRRGQPRRKPPRRPFTSLRRRILLAVAPREPEEGVGNSWGGRREDPWEARGRRHPLLPDPALDSTPGAAWPHRGHGRRAGFGGGDAGDLLPPASYLGSN
uniref:Uncharacterized protein n=1 Tax=Leersia perrieri TaxID=77586 RepID=A0A0D9XLT7_9ORYZ